MALGDPVPLVRPCFPQRILGVIHTPASSTKAYLAVPSGRTPQIYPRSRILRLSAPATYQFVQICDNIPGLYTYVGPRSCDRASFIFNTVNIGIENEMILENRCWIYSFILINFNEKLLKKKNRIFEWETKKQLQRNPNWYDWIYLYYCTRTRKENHWNTLFSIFLGKVLWIRVALTSNLWKIASSRFLFYPNFPRNFFIIPLIVTPPPFFFILRKLGIECSFMYLQVAWRQYLLLWYFNLRSLYMVVYPFEEKKILGSEEIKREEECKEIWRGETGI